MRTKGFLVAFLAGSLLPPYALAEPEFHWLNDWQYTLEPPDANGSSWFGNPTADQATGGANFSPPQLGYGFGSFTSVTFARMFELSGSPRGWDLKPLAQINGDFLHLHAIVSLDFSATVGNEEAQFAALHFTSTGGIGTTGKVIESLGSYSSPIFVTDGTYTISGVNRASLVAVQPGGGAIFAGVSNTFSLSLQATARTVPEPSSIILLVLGGIGLWLPSNWYRRAKKPLEFI